MKINPAFRKTKIQGVVLVERQMRQWDSWRPVWDINLWVTPNHLNLLWGTGNYNFGKSSLQTWYYCHRFNFGIASFWSQTNLLGIYSTGPCLSEDINWFQLCTNITLSKRPHWTDYGGWFSYITVVCLNHQQFITMEDMTKWSLITLIAPKMAGSSLGHEPSLVHRWNMGQIKKSRYTLYTFFSGV